MSDARFKVGQRISVNSAFSPSLQGFIVEEPKFNENEGEFEYVIQTEKHTDLGELGNMLFLESELSSIDDKTADPTKQS